MKAGIGLAFAMATGAALVAGPAAGYNLDAAAGHQYFNADTNYQDVYGPGYLKIRDGREVFLRDPPPPNNTYTGQWVIHLPVDNTNVNWSSQIRGSGSFSHINQRICAYDADGNFSGCGAPQPVTTYSTILVPSGGTAISLTDLMSNCTFVGGGPYYLCAPSGIIASVRVKSP